MKTLLIVALLFTASASADELSECRRLAPKYQARAEVPVEGVRVDLLSDELAIEVDWSHKWPEAVGQSLYYSLITGRKPAILLLVKDADKEQRYIFRCAAVCRAYHITLFTEPSK